MRRLGYAFVLMTLVGCGDATGILIEVSSTDLSAPADLDVLRFIVESADGTRFDQAYPVSALPQSLTVLPGPDANAQVTITVEAVLGGALIVRRVVPSAFVSGSTVRVPVELSGACAGVMCPDGIDCVAGRCGEVMSDAGVDAGRDAGDGDAGPPGMDAGFDAGPPGVDAGPGMDAGFDAGFDAGTDAGFDAGVPNVFFSEYIEGTGSNKALEITNEGSGAMDLSRCMLRRYTNGSMTPSIVAISGVIMPNDVWVLCNSSIVLGSGTCDGMNGALNHNGNDAYDLVCDGAVVDTFGQIGTDPGAEWTGGGLGTADFVLRRRCTVTAGDTNGADAFNPSVEYTGMAYVSPAASHGGLGNRSECP